MAHFEKTLDSTRLYEGKILNLRRDTVLLENGQTAAREVVEHSGGVAVLAIDEQDRIFFVEQFRYPFGRVLLELPAGKLEAGEDPAAAGRRELEEECGCTAAVFEPLGQLYPTCAYDTEIIHLYWAKNLRSTRQQLDADEFLTVKRLPLDEAVRLALAGEIPDAKTQLALLKFATLRRLSQLE